MWKTIRGSPLKQTGPVLSMLVLKCSRTAAPAFSISQEDKCSAAFPYLGWVCIVLSTLQGGLLVFFSVIQICPGKARYTNASLSVILYCTHTLKQPGSCHLSQIIWTTSVALVMALQRCLRLTAMTGRESDTDPSPGDGADAVQEQQHGAPLFCEEQQNWDPSCASPWASPPALHFKLHTAERIGMSHIS